MGRWCLIPKTTQKIINNNIDTAFEIDQDGDLCNSTLIKKYRDGKDKKWYSEEEINKFIEANKQYYIKAGEKHYYVKVDKLKELFGDEN